MPPTPVTAGVLRTEPAEPAISPQVNFLINDMMRDVITRGTGRRAMALGRSDLRGKTGTTDYSVDTWFKSASSRFCIAQQPIVAGNSFRKIPWRRFPTPRTCSLRQAIFC